MTTVYAPQAYISDDRIKEMEALGERARRECRSRIPATATFSNIEKKAFQRGWDRENDKRSWL